MKKNAQGIKELRSEYEHAFFKIYIFGTFIAIYSKKSMPFFTSNVWEFYKSYKKTNVIFEILKKFWVKNVLFMQNILIWQFWPFDMILTWP